MHKDEKDIGVCKPLRGRDSILCYQEAETGGREDGSIIDRES